MRVAHGLVFHRAQTKSLVGVVCRLLQSSIVEDQRLRLGVFQVELAVVGTFNALREVPAGILPAKPGALEEDRVVMLMMPSG